MFGWKRAGAAVAGGILAVSMVGPVAAAEAVPAPRVRVFANCDAMHKVFPHGVMKRKYSKRYWTNHGATARPAYRPLVYRANDGLDRDKDGIACEA